MKPDKDLIEKFLKNQCTAAEAEAVERFFRENPDELERYSPESAWLSDTQKPLMGTISERMLLRIRKQYGDRRRAAITKMFRYAAAASVIGLAVWMGFRFYPNEKGPRVEAAVMPAAVELKVLTNKTGKTMKVTLPDCSIVTLYPASELQYLPAFEEKVRNLYLKGKAGFKVNKDKARPFTVYAAGVATTALGTQFIVSVLQDGQVSVKLNEGVVKVWPQHGTNDSLFVVLQPGDHLVTNSRSFDHYSLNRAKGPEHARKEQKVQANTVLDVDMAEGTSSKLVFKNQPLRDVFKSLEEKFGVVIDHSRAPGIGEKLFTGTFFETDHLPFICALICGLHGLEYTIEGNLVTLRIREGGNS